MRETKKSGQSQGRFLSLFAVSNPGTRLMTSRRAAGLREALRRLGTSQGYVLSHALTDLIQNLLGVLTGCETWLDMQIEHLGVPRSFRNGNNK